MPNLPTLTVTDAQADRMLAAWGTIDHYKAWLQQQIIEFVIEAERRVANQEFMQQQNEAAEATRAELS